VKVHRVAVVTIWLLLTWAASASESDAAAASPGEVKVPTMNHADVLVTAEGERFVGRIIAETPGTVVFESKVAGRLTLSRAQVRELQRQSASEPVSVLPLTNQPPLGTNPLSTFSSPTSTNAWLPPSLGHDNPDWIQLKSGSWLSGRFKYLQDRTVEFDNDELDEQSFRLKDIRQIRPAEPAWVRFDDREEPVFGTVVLSNGVVSVGGAEELTSPRDRVLGITPAGSKGISYWSGNLSVGLSLQSGNNRITTLSTSAELARRTPNTDLVFDYLGNYSEANGIQNANNQRASLTYDVRLDRHWFVRPGSIEYYHDPVANISLRGTAMVGGGYYIFDRSGLTWNVAAGPAAQYTRFEQVETGQSESATTPAAFVSTSFKVDISRRLTLSEKLQSIFTKEEAGQYTHHSVTSLEFKIKRHLDLDVSFVWEYLHKPAMESNGDLPQNSDFYLTLGLGLRF